MMKLRPIKNHHLLRFQPGDRSGCFTVIRALGAKDFGAGTAVVFAVRCDCGHETQRDRQTLIKPTANCEQCRFIGSSPEGSYHHPLYKRWHHMIDRCTNPANGDWKNYGARGIAVCSEWLTGRGEMTGFETFVSDMGPCPPLGTIERRDNSKGYGPTNCIWADKKAQSRNRRGLRLITWQGETLSVGEWAERTGIPYFTLMRRFQRGWTPEKALTKPR